ncbi:MAG: hypothetical protein ACREQ3_00095 [Candidatus Binatia bacterium]
MDAERFSSFREITQERMGEFLQAGYQPRFFFPHSTYYLPKCGPDALKLARRMCGEGDLNKQWEIVLHSTGPLIDELPVDLFFDDDIIWHQQQLGKSGHIAFAYLVVGEGILYGLNYVSDLVQRISRRREFKTRIEKSFKGWHHMLLNSIVNFAVENGIGKMYSPTADLAIENTDPKRTVQRELFERVYDRAVNKYFRATREGKWWLLDIDENRERVIIPEKNRETIKTEKTICVCHDIERGLGHRDVDPAFAKFANETSPNSLEEMLRIENEAGVKATYNVLGCFFNEIRQRVEKDGHCIAFHSYDHNVNADQLAECRQIDYRIKGYRPAQSIITSELSDEYLCFRNFEWLASSASSLGMIFPEMRGRVVKIPILFDDFDMYKEGVRFADWERKAIESINRNSFVVLSLHDCYASFWLPYYREFLEKVRNMGNLKTLNEVANEVILGNAR